MSHLDRTEFAFSTLPVFERVQNNAQNVSFHEKGPCANNKKESPHTAIAGLLISERKCKNPSSKIPQEIASHQ